LNPPSIPDHTLRRPIGRGAYGEVWLARNVMGAPRAVKIVWRLQFESDRPYEREFAGIQRYEPVSRSADGLVHVLHVGRNDTEGCFYYVMELADSAVPSAEGPLEPSVESNAASAEHTPLLAYTPRTLRSDLKRLGRLPTADCLRLALDVIGGLARLHHQGLVHRDVKPGNIIFVNGRAKLADIGLVSASGEARTFVGTEGYIPPEGPGSPVADLYALGVVLYEASTGLSPERFPDVPPEWLNEHSGDDALELHEITLKACEGQRERRYQSAEEMQADLALLQSGQSVRRVRALERRAARARRFGWAALLIVTVAVAASLVANWRARVESEGRAKETNLREEAQQSLARAEAAEREGRERLYAALLAEARATVQSSDAGRRFRTLEAVRQAAAIRNTPELRREAFAALALPDLQVERDINLGRGANSVGLDEGFTRYAFGRGRGAVEVYSLSNQQLLAVLPASTNLTAQLPRFGPDGRYLAFKRDHSGGSESDLEVWDLAATQRVIFAQGAVAREAFSFHPHAPRLLAGRPSGRLVTWDLEHGRELMSWRLPPHWSVCYSPDGTRFAVSCGQGRSAVVEIRDATNGAVLVSAAFPDAVLNVSWHSDGQQVVAPCNDGSVNLVDESDGSVRLLGRHKAQAVRAGIIPESDFVFSGGWDGEVNLWNVRNSQRELMASLGGYTIQFGASGQEAALWLGDGRLRLITFDRGAKGRELAGELNFASRFAKFSPDNRWLAAPAIDGFAVWDLAHPGPAAVNTEAGIGSLDFVPERGELFAASDRRLYRWRLTPALESNSPPRLKALPAFTPRGRVDAARWLTREQSVLLADADGLRLVPFTNAPVGASGGVKAAIFHHALSRDERWFAAVPQRGSIIRIFRVPELTTEGWLTNGAPVRALTFAPDGFTLAVLTVTNLYLWDLASHRITLSRPIEAGRFANLQYAPDGRFLMVVESIRSGALLDARTLEPLLPLPTWTHPLALSTDSRYLAVDVESRRVQVWDLPDVRARLHSLGVDWKD
jgi:WD40 repeat protein